MVNDVPLHLQASVEMLRAYIANPKMRKPVVAVGGFGCGRGHYVSAVLREFGFTPVWLYDPVPINTHDIDGHRLFPVYDLSEVKDPMDRCIIFASSQSEIPEKRRNDFIVIGFSDPPSYALEAFLKVRGYPTDLADGNPNYAALAQAMAVYDASGVRLRQTPQARASWEGFRRGEDPPVDWGLLPYYRAYQDPDDELCNFSNWVERKIPVRVSLVLRAGVRLSWAPGYVQFPTILRHKRPMRGSGAGSRPTAVSAVTEQILQKPAERSYAVEW